MFDSRYPLCKEVDVSENGANTCGVDMHANFNVAFLLTSTLGIIFNALSIIILTVPKEITYYYFLLISLCVSDSVQLLYHWIFSGLSVFGYDFELGWPRFHHVAIFLLNVAFTSSIYIMVMVSFDRYTKSRIPVKVEPPWLAKCRAAKYLAVLVAFSMLFNLPKIWELETCRVLDEEENSNSTTKFDGQHRLQHSELYSDPFYIVFYMIGANILVHWVLPLISLVYLNVSIYAGLKEWKLSRPGLNRPPKQYDWSKTAVLFFIVGFFCICHVWYPLKFVSAYFGTVFWDRMYTFMYCVNCAMNFIIYCICGQACGEQFKPLLKKTEEMKVGFSKLSPWDTDSNARV